MAEKVNVIYTNWSVEDAGFVQISNYFKQFWWPILAPPAAALYELLLVYASYSDGKCYPAIATLAATLHVDRRTLTGREKAGTFYAGAIEVLEAHDLLRTEIDPDPAPRVPKWIFWVNRRPGLLATEQIALLPAGLIDSHTRWIARNVPDSRVGYPTLNDDSRVGCPSPRVGQTTPRVGQTTRTITSNNNQQHRVEEKDENYSVAPATPGFRTNHFWHVILSDRAVREATRNYTAQLVSFDDGRLVIQPRGGDAATRAWRDAEPIIRQIATLPIDTLTVI